MFDNAAFPLAAGIEREWRLIRAELDRVLERQEGLPAFREVVPEFRTTTHDKA